MLKLSFVLPTETWRKMVETCWEERCGSVSVTETQYGRKQCLYFLPICFRKGRFQLLLWFQVSRRYWGPLDWNPTLRNAVARALVSVTSHLVFQGPSPAPVAHRSNRKPFLYFHDLIWGLDVWLVFLVICYKNASKSYKEIKTSLCSAFPKPFDVRNTPLTEGDYSPCLNWLLWRWRTPPSTRCWGWALNSSATCLSSGL